MYDIAVVAAYLLMKIGSCFPRTLHDAIFCSDAIVFARYGKHLIAAHSRRVGHHFFFSSLHDLSIVNERGLLDRHSEDRLASAARARRPYEINRRYADILDDVAERAKAYRIYDVAEIAREREALARRFVKIPPSSRSTTVDTDENRRKG